MCRLAIITGASRGLGQALAQALLASGHELLTLSRHPDSDLRKHVAGPNQYLTQWSMDLRDSASAAQRLHHWLMQQDDHAFSDATLINNAGLIPPVVPLRDSAPADTSNALRVGLEAPMLLTAAFLDATRDWSGMRRIINISSGLGRRPMASQSAYCAAKAGLDLFTRCAALDEARQQNGARMCSLAPGVVDTDMQAHLRAADARAFPDKARFDFLNESGQLSTPAAAAARILRHLYSERFGQQVVADIRELS